MARFKTTLTDRCLTFINQQTDSVTAQQIANALGAHALSVAAALNRLYWHAKVDRWAMPSRHRGRPAFRYRRRERAA